LLKLKPSPIQLATSIDPSEELEKTLSDLNIVEVQVEDLKRTIVTRNEKIHVLKEK
jgi:hypothetical protein